MAQQALLADEEKPEKNRADHKEEVMPVKKPVYAFIKRILDIAVSVFALIILALPMLLIVVVIKIDSKGPAIFKQERLGKAGVPFIMYKFRSMRTDAEDMMEAFTPEQKAEWEEHFKLENDPRTTRIGKFLRKSSLDELPQLINVLKGELSIVGPRPIVQKELELYGDNKDIFLSVTPGLTGYWQAYARSTCSYERRMEMELLYAQKANLWWDIKIFFATFGAVLRAEGAQ